MQPNRRQLQKEQTRRRILEASYRVFSSRGFTATTAEIAREAGVAHGSVFAHFPTLNSLLTCLLSEFGDVIGGRLHTLSEQQASVRLFLEAQLDILQEFEGFYIRLITDVSLLPPEAKTILFEIQSTAAYHFCRAVEAEKEAGRIKNIPSCLLFHSWLGLLHYYLQNKELFAPEGSVLRRYRAELIAVYLELIRNQQEKQ